MGEFTFKWPGKGFAIGDLQISVPIVQGGMGIGVSARNLAVAVANQGGIGVISAVGMGYLNIPCEIEPHEGDNRNITIMRQEIRKARQQTGRSADRSVNRPVSKPDCGAWRNGR